MNHKKPNIPIRDVKLRFVEDGRDGLLAWASLVLGNTVKLDNLAVRRSRDGSLFLTFPAKRSPDGKTHQIYHPISVEASKALQDAVLSRLASLAKTSIEGNPQAK